MYFITEKVREECSFFKANNELVNSFFRWFLSDNFLMSVLMCFFQSRYCCCVLVPDDSTNSYSFTFVWLFHHLYNYSCLHGLWAPLPVLWPLMVLVGRFWYATYSAGFRSNRVWQHFPWRRTNHGKMTLKKSKLSLNQRAGAKVYKLKTTGKKLLVCPLYLKKLV